MMNGMKKVLRRLVAWLICKPVLMEKQMMKIRAAGREGWYLRQVNGCSTLELESSKTCRERKHWDYSYRDGLLLIES